MNIIRSTNVLIVNSRAPGNLLGAITRKCPDVFHYEMEDEADGRVLVPSSCHGDHLDYFWDLLDMVIPHLERWGQKREAQLVGSLAHHSYGGQNRGQ